MADQASGVSSENAKETISNEQPPPYSQQPPQKAPYPVAPQAHHGTTTTTNMVVANQPIGVPIILPMIFGPDPINMTCPHCQAVVVTAITPEVGMLTWLVCGGTALMGLWCGCCFIPFCINELQDCRHTCPNCKNFLGIYRRM